MLNLASQSTDRRTAGAELVALGKDTTAVYYTPIVYCVSFVIIYDYNIE